MLCESENLGQIQIFSSEKEFLPVLAVERLLVSFRDPNWWLAAEAVKRITRLYVVVILSIVV